MIAPAAHVILSNASSMAGAIYARAIDVAETATFQAHNLVPAPVAPLAPGFANGTAGPPAPAGNPDDGPAPSLALEVALGQNTPNPFRPSTPIRFALPSERNVDLKIFALAGRAVKTLARGPLGPGIHTLQWNGMSDRGTRLASGVYFYRLTAGTDRAEKK